MSVFFVKSQARGMVKIECATSSSLKENRPLKYEVSNGFFTPVSGLWFAFVLLKSWLGPSNNREFIAGYGEKSLKNYSGMCLLYVHR